MSRVARKLAESSEEIPAVTPGVVRRCVVPPTKALPVVTRTRTTPTNAAHQEGEETSMRTTRDTYAELV